ncbi:MAG: nicotinate (nicotinamide) nucleotide adenylyltransferase [bacterium]|nr:nicotinate (nicotinamide) nucleotide adenylyltransferase [bacterium]
MKAKNPVTIGILGSACDPPHTEHMEIGEYAKKTLKLDRLILIPTKHPPHKDMPEIPAGMRLQMARVVARKRGWGVSDMEMKRRGKSYTADTIAELKKRYPRAKLFWIVGSDAIVSMPWKWKFGYDILDHCQFVGAKRRGFSMKQVPQKILEKIIVLKRAPSRQVISSTVIRKAIAKKDFKKAKQFLDPEIFRFIIRNRLYGEPR